MELPQPRPFGTGGKKAAHDFLSLFSHSTIQQDPRPSSQDPPRMLGQWTPEQPLQSTSNSRSSSQPSTQKIQSFMEMINFAKGNHEDEDDDDEEFIIKKEGSSTKDDLNLNVDGKSTDQKANTPRSKHSATEQRRRSKINDRFQMLRGLIPHGNQKRDKASFLLEVIEYIQYLQEKVDKYEGSFQGWSHEPAKLMPWINNHRPVENSVVPNGQALNFAVKHDEKHMTASPAVLRSSKNMVEEGIITATTFKATEHPNEPTNKIVSRPIPLHPSIFTPVDIGGAVSKLLPSDSESRRSQPQPQLWEGKTCKTECAISNDKLEGQELDIEGGTISISSVYSQRLLNTLTQALQSSGVDLSQASISLQIDLGKRANTRPTDPASVIKDGEVPSTKQAMLCSTGCSNEDFGQAPKRLKTSKN